MRVLRLVSRTWAKIATELLFELVAVGPSEASSRALSRLAFAPALAPHVRICELALCGPDDDGGLVNHMYNAFILRRFNKLRELSLLFIHDWTPDAANPRAADVAGFGELRRSVLLQLFDDLAPRDFAHLQFLTLRTDAASFVHAMHEFDGSRAKVPHPPPPASILRRLAGLVLLDLCLALEDETGHTFYDYPSLGHYVGRFVAATSQDRLRTLSLAFNASPNWRLRQYNHVQAPFLDRISLPRLQDLFLEDFYISSMELSDFIVEHMQPKYQLRNVHIAGVLMPIPPLEPRQHDLGGWAQFCRDLSPYKNKPLIEFASIGYERGAPLRQLDYEWLQKTMPPQPVGEIIER